ncbi:MAG: CRISPR system precrRNA processing endoribonuclease RAMP protein Cas6, partial [Phycisphaerae bacterium]
EATTVPERHLVWQEIPRFSSRQGEHMSLGGLVGHLVLDLPPGQLGPWLRLAEPIHLGKATSFGLGRVVYEELPR